MRRLLLNSRNHEDQDNEIIDTTPSRWNSVRCPRLRLLDKISKSERENNCERLILKSIDNAAVEHNLKYEMGEKYPAAEYQ
ncbi:unnamed protein product [Xylocopa violacea]|uniref:Uncharacterized protein n=1 Tax=Xylocopa violacea TaxID=135666 RepID=A0ABP1N7Z2_XYLVO